MFDAASREFPVSWAPYCDLGEEIGQNEIDVLNIVLKLRMTGVVPRLGAVFAESFDPADAADQELASLLVDIPSSEHPYDEMHELLEYRGVDVTAEWVRERIVGWISDGTIVSFGVQPA